MKTKNIILVLFLILFVGCEENFLNIRPEGTLPSTGINYSKLENVYKPISAAYAELRNGNAHSFSYIGAFEITSDNADKGSTPEDNPTMKELDEFNFDASNTLINNLWLGFFNIVSAANNAIFQMPLFEENMLNDANKLYTRECAAEAKTIRAYAYFNLTRLFGRVPIIDKQMSSEELASAKQASKTELFQFIEKDLKEAIQILPEFYSKEWGGRINKYTAMAIKAKVHMYHAAFENQSANWDSVASLTDRIIASGKYVLLPDFRSVFSVDQENSKESLFEIQSSTLGLSSGSAPFMEYAYVQGPRNNTPSNMQGWGFCTPSSDLINFLTTRNETARMSATLLYRGTKTPEGDSIKTSVSNPVYNGKVYTPSSYNKWSYNGYGFDHNVRILRYSDVLLMFAEAKVNGSTKGTKSGYSAETALNEVRNRVNLPSIGATLETIWDERRAELAMEEDRYFDLIRIGKAVQTLGNKGFKANKHEVFPIPTQQLKLNLNLIQNQGYN